MWRDVRSFRRHDAKRAGADEYAILVHAILGRLDSTAGGRAPVGHGGETPEPIFRWLVVGLILLGIVGSQVTNKVVREMSQVVVALTNTKA